MVEQQPVCSSDYGSSVYLCRYTGVPVLAEDVVVVGATIPGVKARYFMANTEEARKAKKASGIAFHESEANCNTCAHLERVPHKKHWTGFVYGRCTSPNADKSVHPYKDREVDGVMMMHPDDPMHMPCYKSRW